MKEEEKKKKNMRKNKKNNNKPVTLMKHKHKVAHLITTPVLNPALSPKLYMSSEDGSLVSDTSIIEVYSA